MASLGQLADVDTSTHPPTAGQALLWDAAASLWRPGDAIATETGLQPVPITNPDAESGDLSGWTSEAGSWSAKTSIGSMTAPHGGTWFFYNESAANGILTQTIDLLAAGFTVDQLDGGASFELSAWMDSAFQRDTGILEVDWLDPSDAVLGTGSSGEQGPTSPLGTWDEVILSGSLPAGTRKARLRLQTVNHFGSNSTY